MERFDWRPIRADSQFAELPIVKQSEISRLWVESDRAKEALRHSKVSTGKQQQLQRHFSLRSKSHLPLWARGAGFRTRIGHLELPKSDLYRRASLGGRSLSSLLSTGPKALPGLNPSECSRYNNNNRINRFFLKFIIFENSFLIFIMAHGTALRLNKNN